MADDRQQGWQPDSSESKGIDHRPSTASPIPNDGIDAKNSRTTLLKPGDSHSKYGAFVAGNSVVYPDATKAATCCLGGTTPFNYETILAPEDARRLREMKQVLATSFDTSNPEHEDALHLLWRLSFPNERLDARKSEQWMKLGFQGHDPATDFRGGGLASLQFMIYMARHYPAQWQGLLNPEREYSLAIACINVTHFLREALGLSPSTQKAIPLKVKPPKKKAKHSFAVIFASYANAFEELFCTCLEVMDGLWIEIMKGKGNKFTLDDLAALTHQFRQRVLTVFNKLPRKRVTLLHLRRRMVHGLPRRIPPTIPLETNASRKRPRKRAVSQVSEPETEDVPTMAQATGV